MKLTKTQLEIREMTKYIILDTVTGDTIGRYHTEAAARRDQKLFNASSCAVHHGNGFAVRFAVKRAQ